MRFSVAASIGKPVLVSCGAGDCEAKHETFAVHDVLVMDGMMPNDLADQQEGVEEAVAQGVIVRGKSHTFVTMLGAWLDEVSDNYN